jgi:hypothetical protein
MDHGLPLTPSPARPDTHPPQIVCLEEGALFDRATLCIAEAECGNDATKTLLVARYRALSRFHLQQYFDSEGAAVCLMRGCPQGLFLMPLGLKQAALLIASIVLSLSVLATHHRHRPTTRTTARRPPAHRHADKVCR